MKVEMEGKVLSLSWCAAESAFVYVRGATATLLRAVVTAKPDITVTLPAKVLEVHPAEDWAEVLRAVFVAANPGTRLRKVIVTAAWAPARSEHPAAAPSPTATAASPTGEGISSGAPAPQPKTGSRGTRLLAWMRAHPGELLTLDIARTVLEEPGLTGTQLCVEAQAIRKNRLGVGEEVTNTPRRGYTYTGPGIVTPSDPAGSDAPGAGASPGTVGAAVDAGATGGRATRLLAWMRANPGAMLTHQMARDLLGEPGFANTQLCFEMAAARRKLGQGEAIVNSVGKGYTFTGPSAAAPGNPAGSDDSGAGAGAGTAGAAADAGATGDAPGAGSAPPAAAKVTDGRATRLLAWMRGHPGVMLTHQMARDLLGEPGFANTQLSFEMSAARMKLGKGEEIGNTRGQGYTYTGPSAATPTGCPDSRPSGAANAADGSDAPADAEAAGSSGDSAAQGSASTSIGQMRTLLAHFRGHPGEPVTADDVRKLLGRSAYSDGQLASAVDKVRRGLVPGEEIVRNGDGSYTLGKPAASPGGAGNGTGEQGAGGNGAKPGRAQPTSTVAELLAGTACPAPTSPVVESVCARKPGLRMREGSFTPRTFAAYCCLQESTGSVTVAQMQAALPPGLRRDGFDIVLDSIRETLGEHRVWGEELAEVSPGRYQLRRVASAASK